jgi:hypothetical protein
MKKDAKQLPSEPQVLQQMVLALQSQVESLVAQNQHLLEQFRLAQKNRFGRSSEAHPGQEDLFNEAEAEVEAAEPETEDISYSRKKPSRKKLPTDLPREVIVHDIPEADKICDCCGGERHQMGEECSEQLEYIPAVIKVIEHVRPKYGCRTCENKGTKVEIKIAPVAPSVIPKSIATLIIESNHYPQISIQLAIIPAGKFVQATGYCIEPTNHVGLDDKS